MGEKITILTMPPKRSRSLHGQIRHLQDNRRIFSRKESNFVHKARNIQHREQHAKDASLTEHEMGQKYGDDFKKDKDRLTGIYDWTYPKGVTQNRGKDMSWEEHGEYSRNKEARLKRNHENRIKSIQNSIKLIQEGKLDRNTYIDTFLKRNKEK